jgi:hypothetical protein
MSHGISPLSGGVPIQEYYTDPYEYIDIGSAYTGDEIPVPSNIFAIFSAYDVTVASNLGALPAPDYGRAILAINNSAYDMYITGQSTLSAESIVMFIGTGTTWIRCGL